MQWMNGAQYFLYVPQHCVIGGYECDFNFCSEASAVLVRS